SLKPTAHFDPTDVSFNVTCPGQASAKVLTGINTLLLSASDSQPPDLIALAATATNDQILHLTPTLPHSGAFSVATVNNGAASTFTGDAYAPGVALSSLQICQTNPTNGQCIAAASSQVTFNANSGAKPTFSVFAFANGDIPFDPAGSRIFVRFKDSQGV